MDNQELISWIEQNILDSNRKVIHCQKQWFDNRNFSQQYKEICERIEDDDVPFAGKVKLLLQEKLERPRCLKCGNFTKYSNGKYALYCCYQCSNKITANDKEVILKKQKTNIEKYGVDNPGKTGRHVETMRNRYGVDSPMKVKEFKEKVLTSQKEKYGDLFLKTTAGKEKTRKAFQEKYNADHPMHVRHIVEKMENTNIERFGAKQIFALDEIKQKISKTIEEKYPVHFNSKPVDIEQIRELYFDENLTLKEVSNTIDNFICGNQIGEILRKNGFVLRKPNSFGQSSQERKIHQLLDEHGIIYRCNDRIFFRDDHDKRTKQELDILIPSHDLAIEINGHYYHSELFKEKNYHINKTNKCHDLGIRLVHILDIEINKSFDKISSIILGMIGKHCKVGARQTTLRLIDIKTAKEFANKNHIQGFASANYHLGLFHNNELVAYMSFGPSRFNRNFQYELVRHCTKLNTTVVGGASKLFKYFCKIYHPVNIISYSDKRMFTGELYSKLGFNHQELTKPNYHYVKNDEIYNRQSFQKKKMRQMSNFEFNERLSEHANALNNGYIRIYDCGQDVWTWQ